MNTKERNEIKAEAVNELIDLAHEGQIKVQVSIHPYRCDWVEIDEWLQQQHDAMLSKED